MQTSETIERLNEVVRVLRAVPDEKFAMETWFNIKRECGTVACAIGWAAQDEWFRSRGLMLGHWEDNANIVWPVYEDSLGFRAIAEFFGITEDNASDLFSDEDYEGYGSVDEDDYKSIPKEVVVARLEEFIASLERKGRICEIIAELVA